MDLEGRKVDGWVGVVGLHLQSLLRLLLDDAIRSLQLAETVASGTNLHKDGFWVFAYHDAETSQYTPHPRFLRTWHPIKPPPQPGRRSPPSPGRIDAF